MHALHAAANVGELKLSFGIFSLARVAKDSSSFCSKPFTVANLRRPLQQIQASVTVYWYIYLI